VLGADCASLEVFSVRAVNAGRLKAHGRSGGAVALSRVKDMYSMQYELTLPADYDMGIIRSRVAERGSRTDDFAGLRFKAYLVRERGVENSPVNQYAPFYLWDDTAAMGSFLWGGRGFGGIVSDFGRPTVQTWTGVGVLAGTGDRASEGAAPVFATRYIRPLGDGIDPTDAVPGLLEQLAFRASVRGVHTAMMAIDPRTWEVIEFTLWTDAAPLHVPGVRYSVLHLSQPTAS
jgi:hypothetical protein